MVQPTFCGQCGAKLFALSPSVYRCENQHLHYVNPIPVVVLLVPQFRPNSQSVPLLIVRRKIAPHAGKWALPGGFVEFGQSIKQACSAELKQETGLVVEPELWTCFAADSTPDTRQILLFMQCPAVQDALSGFLPNDEVTEVDVCCVGEAGETELCFPMHQAYGSRFRTKCAIGRVGQLPQL